MLTNVVSKPLSAEKALPINAGRLSEEAEVIVRLCGRVVDVEAAGSHWRIAVERQCTNNNLHDECAVDGILSLGCQ